MKYLFYLWILSELSVLSLGFTYGNTTNNLNDKPTDNCVCETFSCVCCGTLLVPQIGLNDTFCLSVAYLPKEYGLSLVIEVDNKVLINETISAVNPPPVCIPIPYVEDFFDFCVHFTDLKINNDNFHGCASLEARMWWVYVVAEIHLGCWNTAGIKASNGSTVAPSNATKQPVFEFGDLPKPSLKLAGEITLKAAKKFLKMKAASKVSEESNDVLHALPVKRVLNRASAMKFSEESEGFLRRFRRRFRGGSYGGASYIILRSLRLKGSKGASAMVYPSSFIVVLLFCVSAVWLKLVHPII